MIGSIVILMIPIAIFFASMLLSISFYSRSFKEAQSLMGPLNMVIIVPLFLSLGPGMEMDHATALMPLINVGLLTKEILAGSVELIYFIETLFSLLFCAAIGIWFSVYWFKKENTIFISLGARYIFKKDTIENFFLNNLVNFRGTRLPLDAGGGGFSWKIMSYPAR